MTAAAVASPASPSDARELERFRQFLSSQPADMTLAQLLAAWPDYFGFQPPEFGQDTTPELHVGDSAFEKWYSETDFGHRTFAHSKQDMRDSYAAGMGDHLVCSRKAVHEMAKSLAAKPLSPEQLTLLARTGCGGDDIRWTFSEKGLSRMLQTYAAIVLAGAASHFAPPEA